MILIVYFWTGYVESIHIKAKKKDNYYVPYLILKLSAFCVFDLCY